MENIEKYSFVNVDIERRGILEYLFKRKSKIEELMSYPVLIVYNREDADIKTVWASSSLNVQKENLIKIK